jgi:hypothetical protein
MPAMNSFFQAAIFEMLFPSALNAMETLFQITSALL